MDQEANSKSIDVANEDIPSLINRLELFILARLILLCLVLTTTIFLKQEVLGVDSIKQIYTALALSFFFSFLHLSFWEGIKKVRLYFIYQLVYDILLTSYLVYLTGINESIFLFLYILNVIFAAIAYQTLGALSIAGFAGLFYGVICVNNISDNASARVWYDLGYNEVFILVTALLSGQLAEEFRRQRELLIAQKENLNRLEQLHSLLLNNIPVGIIVANQEGLIESMNMASLKMLDVAQDKVHTHYFDIIPSIKGVPENWSKLPSRKKVRYQVDHISANGKKKTLSLQVVKQSIQNTRNLFILVFQDISEILELESKLAFESNLSATGQLAAGIAHEIRNPLASISGSIEMLNAHLNPENEEDRKLIAIALRETKRLNQLITGFLEYAKPKENVAEVFSLKTKLSEVADAVKTRVKEGSAVEFLVDIPESTKVLADSEKLKQVFFNLFINSLEASKDHSTTIQIKSSVEGNEVVIDIIDDGPGIPPEIRGKIFDPFFTTKSTGTGLGLSTVAQIIKAAKGSIYLVQRESGTQFQIHLPAAESEIV